MAPQIDFMVKSGLMDAETGANHPDRNCLISVLMGTRIPKIDCPAKPTELRAGDIVICASDGLQFMSNAQIEKVVGKYARKRSTEIAERLLEELQKLDDPDQDNISFTIIKVNDASVRPKEDKLPGPSMAVARPRRLTKVATDPLLLPRKAPPPAVKPAPEVEALPKTPVPIPKPTVVNVALPPAETGIDDQPVENLSSARLRPRRVVVIK